MSKKLICLFLSLLLLLSVCLTACGEKSKDDAYADKVQQASQSAVTLSMYLMSEEPVSAETAKKIEDALNDITERKFTIRMKLHFFTPAEYYTKLEESFAAYATASVNGTLRADADKNKDVLDPAATGGKVQILYPGIADYQVDLFYLGGQDKFDQYRNANLFADLDDQLQSAVADQQLRYMPEHYFDYIKLINGGDSYAVANAKAIGEYTYLLLNKDALEAASRRSPAGITTYEEYTALTCEEVQKFLAYVNDPDSGLTDTYYPLYTNLDRRELLFNNVQFMGTGEDGKLTDEFSVLGGYLQKASTAESYTNMYAELSNLMENKTFLSEMETLVKYEEEGYYSTNEESGKEFAVGYVTGDATLTLEYGDEYEMLPIGKPMLTEEEIYEDMFAVYANSTNVSKSMQILSLINTDEEVRNLLLYGIEGEHYQLVDSDMRDEFGVSYKLAERLNNNYVMSAERTGNTLLTTPEKVKETGENAEPVIPNIKEYIVQQNLDATVNLTSGFRSNYRADGEDTQLKVNMTELQTIRTLSAKIWEKYMACKTVAEFEEFKTWAAAEMEKAEYKDAQGNFIVDKHLHYTADGKIAHWTDDAPKFCEAIMRCESESLACVYNAWLKDMGVTR